MPDPLLIGLLFFGLFLAAAGIITFIFTYKSVEQINGLLGIHLLLKLFHHISPKDSYFKRELIPKLDALQRSLFKLCVLFLELLIALAGFFFIFLSLLGYFQ